MAAYRENQLKVVVEFLKTSGGMGHGRVIRLNHTAGGLPPQLFGRVDQSLWAAFMGEVEALARSHPYTQAPSAGKVAGWAACFAIGSVIGLCCVDPDGGDFGVWEYQLRALVDRYASYFSAAGCSLSLHASQRRRDYWLEIDINPGVVVGQPVLHGPELHPILAPPPAAALASTERAWRRRSVVPGRCFASTLCSMTLSLLSSPGYSMRLPLLSNVEAGILPKAGCASEEVPAAPQRQHDSPWHRAAAAGAAALLLLGAAGGAVLWASPPRAAEAPNVAELAVFKPGTIPLDDQGNQVHAHGGQLIQDETGAGGFYWVGTSRKVPPWWTSWAITLYHSPDLQHWSLASVILSWQQISGFPDRWPYGHLDAPPPPYRIERPKLLHHKSRGYWVLMFHLDSPGFELPAVGVATAPNITGPYTYRHHFWPDENTSYDMTLHYDEETDEAYLVRSCPVMTIAVSRLHPDWLATEGTVCSTTGHGAEGPAVFKWSGRHYIFASHLTGWDPNPPILHQSTTGGMCSTFWRDMPRPSHGPEADSDYQSQSTYIFPYRFSDGSTLLLYMGDRWNANGPGSVGAASYVWLPLLPKLGGKSEGFELVYEEEWSLAQFKGAAWDAAAQQIMFADGTRRADAGPPRRAYQPRRSANSSRLAHRPVWQQAGAAQRGDA